MIGPDGEQRYWCPVCERWRHASLFGFDSGGHVYITCAACRDGEIQGVFYRVSERDGNL